MVLIGWVEIANSRVPLFNTNSIVGKIAYCVKSGQVLRIQLTNEQHGQIYT